MKHFAYTLAVAGMVSSIGTFAAAQSDVDAATTTCADFTAMSAEDQRSALDTLNSADASAGASASTDGMDAEADISGDADASTSMSDDTVSDPVSDSHDADTTTETEAATTDLSAEIEADADASADASEDPEVQAIIAACEGNEDALVADQVSPK